MQPMIAEYRILEWSYDPNQPGWYTTDDGAFPNEELAISKIYQKCKKFVEAGCPGERTPNYKIRKTFCPNNPAWYKDKNQ